MGVTLRVADVIRSCWSRLNRTQALVPQAARAVRHILQCRTAALGGHMHVCDQCASQLPVYNSCQSRHCPSCQNNAKRKWLDARLGDLLPVQYFHVVFTLPHELNGLVNANRSLLLGELFATVNWTLQAFASDPQWRLEGSLGFVAMLHTWTQRLMLHFHIHCLVPGGVWRAETQSWKSCRGQWLFRKDSLAEAFRNRYLQRLKSLRCRGKLSYGGQAAALEADRSWQELIDSLQVVKWIVYPKSVPASPEKALAYLARYTHKVAISDSRITALEGDRVTYRWLDRADNSLQKSQTLSTEDFTKRFLAHILPDGFHKIRYYGWMAAACRRPLLVAIRDALDIEAPPKCKKEPYAQRILRETGKDITLCPYCQKGHMQLTPLTLPRTRGHPL